jgi:phage FluMu gp28-like protein
MDIASWWPKCRAIEAIVKTPRADLMLRYFDIEAATGENGAVFAPFQVNYLNSTATLFTANKSRQIGASFIAAGDALAECILRPRHTELMVSYNLEEAKEKIRYAQAWWSARHSKPWLVPAYGEFDEHGNHRGKSKARITRWPTIVKSSQLEIVFDNGSRMLSHPSRPPRGKSASVIADEAAHCQNFNAIYVAALPMITRGVGKRMKLMSTPLGASGRWWEIHTDVAKYPEYERHDYGWWEISDLCNDMFECWKAWRSGMDPELMVRRFGTRKMKLLYQNMLPEDFLQEYALVFQDSIHAFLPWDLIKSCYPLELKAALDRREAEDIRDMPEELDFDTTAVLDEAKREYFYSMVRCKDGEIDAAIECIQEFLDWVAETDPSGVFVWAFDVGRDKDVSEVTVFQVVGRRRMQRLLLTMPRMRFEKQRDAIWLLLSCTRIVAGYIDKGGIGRQIAEQATTRFGERATGVHFTAEIKDRWAVELKKTMELGNLSLIPNRDQEQQLHSIRRHIGDQSKVFQYVLDETTSTIGGGKKIKHHADKFWTVAMANYLASRMAFSMGSPATGDAMVSSTIPQKLAEVGIGRKTKVPRSSGGVIRSRSASSVFGKTVRG